MLKQFYQTALGNSCGSKLPKCSFKNKFIVSYTIILGTLSFPINRLTRVVTFTSLPRSSAFLLQEFVNFCYLSNILIALWLTVGGVAQW